MSPLHNMSGVDDYDEGVEHLQYVYPPPRLGGKGYPIDSYEDIINVNQSSFATLMRQHEFNGQSRIALTAFKSRLNKSEWMRNQRGYLERACLAAAGAGRAGVSFNQCGRQFSKKTTGRSVLQTCKQTCFCPGCKLHRAIEPVQAEYASAYAKANYWYAVTAGWQNDPEIAGMHWVIKQDKNGRAIDHEHYWPWAGKQHAPLMGRVGSDDVEAMHTYAEMPFKLAEKLKEKGWFDGLFATLEWHVEFYPDKKGGCQHSAMLHVHMFGNRSEPLTFEQGKEIQDLYTKICCRSNSALPAYPDLEIAPIISQARLKSWINYQIKTIPVERFYKEGLRNGCSVAALNAEFQQTAWELPNLVRSPRKYGNLYVSKPGYIGEQQFKKVTKSQYERLCRTESESTLNDSERKLLHNHRKAVDQYRIRADERRKRKQQQKNAEEARLIAAVNIPIESSPEAH